MLFQGDWFCPECKPKQQADKGKKGVPKQALEETLGSIRNVSAERHTQKRINASSEGQVNCKRQLQFQSCSIGSKYAWS